MKSLQLQAEMMQEFDACVFDVTLDCEDGAPVGGEHDHAVMAAELAVASQLPGRRIGLRVHAVDHSSFEDDVHTVVRIAAGALSYLMVPKVESVQQVDCAARAVDEALRSAGHDCALPLHVLIESPAAVHQAFNIAAHPRVQSISFGLMDFVSAHGGAIPSAAMGVRAVSDTQTLDQFHHPLVVRAKTDIASACHAHGKVPSHCVVTEFRDPAALRRSARYAAMALGYTRMWSIHPDQIRPILEAFAPARDEVEKAAEVVAAAEAAQWAPISVAGTLHDRASYRYFWQVLERAHQTGCAIPQQARSYFVDVGH